MSRTIHIDTGKHTSHTLADPVRDIREIVEYGGPGSRSVCGHHRIDEVSGKICNTRVEGL